MICPSPLLYEQFISTLFLGLYIPGISLHVFFHTNFPSLKTFILGPVMLQVHPPKLPSLQSLYRYSHINHHTLSREPFLATQVPMPAPKVWLQEKTFQQEQLAGVLPHPPWHAPSSISGTTCTVRTRCKAIPHDRRLAGGEIHSLAGTCL